eukprot:gene16816-biopygen25738
MLEFQPPPRPELLPSPSPALLLTTSPSYPSNSGGRISDPKPPTRQFYGTELACLLAVTRSKAVKPNIWPSQPPAPANSQQPTANSHRPSAVATLPSFAPSAIFRSKSSTRPRKTGNGFVERSVGTIKAALTKICSENLATDTWDIDIAKVVTAYNCSPQETTKCAPFTLLYARAPVMNNPEAQLAMTAPLPDLTDSTQVQALTDTLLERAQWIKRVSPTIANHIAIAHHRDTLRYAKIRGGAYHPRLRKFQVGDFVYIRRPNVRNSLQMAAQGMILRIIDLKPTEVVVLQGRCVPVEDWFCPNCKASGITAIPAGRIPEAPQKEPNLFPTPQTRSRDRAALACDKMLVIKQVRVQGGLDKAVWGTASFQGPLSRPW